MLEYEIIPAYYSFDNQGVPVEWISHIKNTMVKIAPEFTMKRQIDDYYEKYYNKLYARTKHLTANNFEKAKNIADWKQTMKDEWDNIEVLNYSFEKPKENVFHSGHDYKAEIALNIHNIPKENVGVEYVLTHLNKEGKYEFVASKDFSLVSSRTANVCIGLSWCLKRQAPSFTESESIKHEDLPHKQDFYLLRWID